MINLEKINTVNWENINIAILGSGASGIGAAKLAIHLKAKVLLSDVKKSDLDIDENNYFTYEYSGHSNKVLESDLIIKSPGIPNQIDIIKKSKQRNIPIVSEIEFASWFSDSDIIAVTGSNGKTTTVNLIFEIFKKANKDVMLGGNVGVPLSENVLHEIKSAKNYTHIVEVSSYQAEYLYHFNPKISCILNISEDHMDRYDNMDSYVDAKLNILKNISKNEKFIYNSDDKKLSDRISCYIEEINPLYEIIPFSIFDNSWVKYNANGKLEINKCEFESRLLGDHNLYNISAATIIANYYDIDLKNTIQAIEEFNPLPHRIEFVKIDKDNNVQYINDSKSTTIASTIAAVKCFENIILIIGGQEKGKLNSNELLECINQKNINSVVIYGSISQLLKNTLDLHDNIEYCYDFHDAINKAVNLSFNGSTILLSPGFSSFDQFDNYKQRGEVFKKIILGNNYYVK